MGAPPAPAATPVPWGTLISLFVAVSCAKILLMPSYRSTDFDVHRNWLAIARHLPLKEWYYNDVNGTTVHTLDYPPTFAYFEYLLANNPVTNWLLRHDYLDDRCLALLPDTNNTPTVACIVFSRATVIASDLVLWWGSWIASANAHVQVHHNNAETHSVQNKAPRYHRLYLAKRDVWLPTSFLLIVLHPGLLWLDHVHFQYNGMLFGIFLASIGYLLQGNNLRDNNTATGDFHKCHWKAAVLFALLLTMKHLFLTLAPFYFVYLLRRYCLSWQPEPQRLQLQPLRLLALGMYTGTTLLVPFLPFLKQLPQVATRLFPFGRGLVHDYWAANVWALYTLVQDKVLPKLLPDLKPLPQVEASTCASLLLVALLPGLYWGAWKAAAEENNVRLLLAVVYSALASFQLGFHVHEKAILNAMIPLTLLVTMRRTITSTTVRIPNHQDLTDFRMLFWCMSAFGLLGLFPLLFRPAETPLKLVSYIAYLAVCYHVLLEQPPQTSNTTTSSSSDHGSSSSPKKKTVSSPPGTALTLTQQAVLFLTTMLVMGIVMILEFVPMKWFGKLEFLPLLCTSVGCAAGLILCWLHLLQLIIYL